MSTLFAQIEALNIKLDEAIALEKEAKTSYDKWLAHEAELDRQRLYHMGNNDYPNAQIVSDDLRDNVRPNREIAGNLWNQRKAETQTAIDKLAAAKAALTVSEQNALTKEQELQIIAAQVELTKALELKAQNEKEAEQVKANYAASNVKYYVAAGIAFFVVVMVALVGYFRTQSNKA